MPSGEKASTSARSSAGSRVSTGSPVNLAKSPGHHSKARLAHSVELVYLSGPIAMSGWIKRLDTRKDPGVSAVGAIDRAEEAGMDARIRGTATSVHTGTRRPAPRLDRRRAALIEGLNPSSTSRRSWPACALPSCTTG